MNDYQSLRRRETHQVQKTYELSDDARISKAKSILILEDDLPLTFMLKEVLQTKNYQVTVVSNGADGLKQILTNDFSVILCDMIMPNFPGEMFYLAVERTRPSLCKRFIFMTGHQGDRKIEQFIRRIKGLMLWKPFEMHVLLEAVDVIGKKNEQKR